MKSTLIACMVLVSVACVAQHERILEMKRSHPVNSFEKRTISLSESLQQLQPESTPRKKERNGTWTVAVMLPFSASKTSAVIHSLLEQKENKTKIKLLSDDAKTALDFYDGALLALKNIESASSAKVKLHLHFFDTYGSDSVTGELLKDKNMYNADIIIGPPSHHGARQVAEFCKKHEIINIQPFSPSKSIASNNPFHIKIAPTMDAHIDNIVRSLADSFMKENIIIYTTSAQRDWQAASRLDSLIRNFDGVGKTRFRTVVYNVSNPIVKGEKKSLGDLLSTAQRNIVVACVFDEANAQMLIRQLASAKQQVVLYGMPTWLASEILRIDYLNKLQTRFTDQFLEDTSDNKKAVEFVNLYREHYQYFPPKFAWLGFDVINWLYQSINENDRFPENIQESFYSGAGYKFQFRAVERPKTTDENKGIEYYENSFVHLLRMENYSLIKLW
jgi:ABC-type branched-subunit amino acid transport system substrate-binding protein